MIETPTFAGQAAIDWLRSFDPDAQPSLIGAVDLGEVWRVYFSWEGPTADRPDPHPNPVAVLVGKGSGNCGMEWPVLKIGPTAQAAMSAMVKEQVIPGLRNLGFKGSARNFDLQAPHHYATLNIQKSSGNTRAVLRFTINVSVISREAWASYRSSDAPPEAGVHYGVGWCQRLGHLTPQRYDRWWHVYAGLPTADTASEILAAVRDYALPVMREKMSAT